MDKRADIWAFGVLLCEVLAAPPPPPGDPLPATGRRHPPAPPLGGPPGGGGRPAAALPPQTPPPGAPAPAARARRVEALPGGRGQRGGSSAAARPHPLWRRAMPVVASVVATGLVVGGATWMAARPSLDRLVQHLSLAHPQPEVVGGNDFDDNIAVSPDGRSVAYVAAATSVNSNILAALPSRPRPARTGAPVCNGACTLLFRQMASG